MYDNELKILHISDLHFGYFGPKYGDSAIMKKYWQKINEKIEEYSQNNEDIRPNLVLITGDIGSKGVIEDFEKASLFIRQNLNQFLEEKLLVIIPGNHDLSWIKTDGRRNKNRFQNYFDFIKKLGLISNTITYDQYLENPHYIKRIEKYSTLILGLNSCLYTAYDVDFDDPNNCAKSKFNSDISCKNHSEINEDQLLKRLESIDKSEYERYSYKIAILHHNILPHLDNRAYLSNYERILGWLKEKGFNLILHGHLHDKTVYNHESFLTIGAGSYGADEVKYRREFNIIKLRLEDNFCRIPLQSIYIPWCTLYSFTIDDSAELNELVSEPKIDDRPIQFDKNIYQEICKGFNVVIKILENSQIRNTEDLLKLNAALENSFLAIKTSGFQNPDLFIDELKSRINKKLEEKADLNKIFKDFQSTFLTFFNSRMFSDSQKSLVILTCFPIEFFLRKDLKIDDQFIETIQNLKNNDISEISKDLNLIPIKSKLDLLLYQFNPEIFLKNNKINDFLNQIDLKFEDSISFFYKWMDFIYVPPLEYEDIENNLRANKILLLTGTPKFGKTYTALYLMWKYFNKGYSPKWIHGEKKIERDKIRKNFQLIENNLKPNHIIYIEDPFGKIKYEDETNLEENINKLVDKVRNINDLYVIISSREDVFERFKKGTLKGDILAFFEKRIGIKRPSYSTEKRNELIIKLAKIQNCIWLNDETLIDFILKQIENKNNLPTPLNIKDFIVNSISITDKEELLNNIKKYSEDTAIIFAKEIKEMSPAHKLFLSFLYISEFFKDSFIKEIFQLLCSKLALKSILTYEEISKEFLKNKINITQYNWIKFSHPSYSEALKYVLIEDDKFKTIYITLLFTLSEKDAAVEYVAMAIARNFEKLPERIREQLLLKLSENDAAAGYVAWVVARNFEKLPENVQQFLFTLSENDAAAGDVAWAVANNYDKLPEKVQQLLFTLSEKEAAAGELAWAVARNFNKLPENVQQLLFTLSEKDAAAGGVAMAIARNFEKLPERVREQLLLKLSEKDAAAGDVAMAIARNFEKLPERVREQLLLKLSKKYAAVGDVVIAVARNFNKLPEKVQQLLFTVSENDAAARYVAGTVADNYDKLPENVQQLLFTLSKKEKTAKIIVNLLKENFDKLPENVRNDLLYNLSNFKSTHVELVKIVQSNYDKILEKLRNKIMNNQRD